MGRFGIKDGKITDEYGKFDNITFNEKNVICLLNELEMHKLEKKRELNTLKYRIKRLVE